MEITHQYQMGQLIGEGAQGKVFEVRQKTSGRSCVLKLFPNENHAAQKEVAILGEFGGNHIPYLIDCGVFSGGYGIVMEYAKGQSLEEHLKKNGILPREQAVSIALQIGAVLKAFHGHVPRIVYGDLNPKNILVTEKGEVTLVDFGAVLFGGERNEAVFGTMSYLSSKEEYLDPHRDVYALGVLMYEMLTGLSPTEGVTANKADVHHLPKQLRETMQKATRLNRTMSYESMIDMYEDLKKCNEETETEGRHRRRKGKRKKRKECYYIMDMKRLWETGGGTMLLVLGLLFGIGLFVFGGKTEPEREDYRVETVRVTTGYSLLGQGAEKPGKGAAIIKEIKRGP